MRRLELILFIFIFMNACGKSLEEVKEKYQVQINKNFKNIKKIGFLLKKMKPKQFSDKNFELKKVTRALFLNMKDLFMNMKQNFMNHFSLVMQVQKLMNNQIYESGDKIEKKMIKPLINSKIAVVFVPEVVTPPKILKIEMFESGEIIGKIHLFIIESQKYLGSFSMRVFNSESIDINYYAKTIKEQLSFEKVLKHLIDELKNNFKKQICLKLKSYNIRLNICE